MRKWKSKINGKQLRESIKNGSSFEILKVLLFELHFKIKSTKDEHERCEFDDLYELVKSDVEIGEEGLIKWVNEEEWSMTELVDDRLAQFYDLCDRWNIWVTV